MSLARTTKLTCPECSHEQEMEIWTSVNVSIHPHLKEKVMKLLLNVFICEKCDHHAHVDTSFLYHDMQARYCVQYVAREDMESPKFYENLSKQGTLVFDLPTSESVTVSGNDYFFRPHFVFSVKELPLYIAFRELCGLLGKEA
ncbi:hypothetical protein BH09VER1_BH09VER1_04810 [soil metagenome]